MQFIMVDLNLEDDFFDLKNLNEQVDLELKTAHGRDGKGKLPQSFWESYSAMANTEGGVIILGIKETDNGPEFVGVPEHEKVVQTLFDQANNSQIVSVNLLSDRSIKRLEVKGLTIILVTVPRADRKARPVHIGKNPLTGTFRRNNEGDYRCPREVVEQMLGERVRDTQDSTILEGFSIADVDMETLRIYRQNFANRQPAHVLNNLDAVEYLEQLGGYATDRQTGKSGLTIAGLLMFGKLRSILDAIPRYVVDYQERPRAVKEARWIDRLTTDFSWSGNLYDFYRSVYGKLTSDLKIPFALKGDQRIEDTPVHEALREALVNTLIHADYTSNCSILIVKRPDLFGFRNPGILRVPLKEAIRGGTSDCRNRNLQKMFQLIGLGEQSGFGFPKIYKSWAGQHWRAPDIEERIETDQTILALRMVSLMPEASIEYLQNQFGELFDELSQPERIALVTAHAEGCISHARLTELTSEHSSDLTNILHGLVAKGLLLSEGRSTATFYYLPGAHPIENSGATEVFGLDVLGVNSPPTARNSLPKDANSLPKDANSLPKDANSLPKDEFERHIGALVEIATPVSSTRRAPRSLVEETILKLCEGRFLLLSELSQLLHREAESLRNKYIAPMLSGERLKAEHPNIKNHPKQRYTTAGSPSKGSQVK
jgi:ATP-dependent DNA helicase RecG